MFTGITVNIEKTKHLMVLGHKPKVFLLFSCVVFLSRQLKYNIVEILLQAKTLRKEVDSCIY